MSSMFDLFPLQVLNISDLGGIGNLAIFRMIYFGVVLNFSYKTFNNYCMYILQSHNYYTYVF